MTIHTRRATQASVLGACVLAAAAAQSDDAGAPLSVKVRYSDLELASDGGARTMLARIESAARRVCGQAPDLRESGPRRPLRSLSVGRRRSGG